MTETTDGRLSSRMVVTPEAPDLVHPSRTLQGCSGPQVTSCLGDQLETHDEDSSMRSDKHRESNVDRDSPPYDLIDLNYLVDSNGRYLYPTGVWVHTLPPGVPRFVQSSSIPASMPRERLESDDEWSLPGSDTGRLSVTSVLESGRSTPNDEDTLIPCNTKEQSEAGGWAGPCKEVLQAVEQCEGNTLEVQELQQHLEFVTMTSDLQAQETLHEQESLTEQQGWLQGVLAWLRRFRKGIKNLRKRRRKSGRVGPDPRAEAPSEADAYRYMRACDLWQLNQLHQLLQDMDSQVQRKRQWILQEIDVVMARLQSTEHVGPIPGCGSIHPYSFLLPPANCDFGSQSGPADSSEEVVDPKEEKRRRKEMLKSKKPKNMGLKRRFFLCLRCLT